MLVARGNGAGTNSTYGLASTHPNLMFYNTHERPNVVPYSRAGNLGRPCNAPASIKTRHLQLTLSMAPPAPGNVSDSDFSFMDANDPFYIPLLANTSSHSVWPGPAGNVVPGHLTPGASFTNHHR